MSAGAFLRSTIALVLGYGVAAAAVWTLLNVPESNVLALIASALLALLAAVVAGITTGIAAALTHRVAIGPAARRAVGALPMFAVGLMVFAGLWWLTGWKEAWWQAHRGEVDAVFLRYFGFTGTQPLYDLTGWILWFVRWALGLSVIASLIVAKVFDESATTIRGLRLSVTLLPLVAWATGTLIVTEALWRVAYWRPVSLPATRAELVFAAIKLAVLYFLAAGIGAAVLGVYSHAVAGGPGTMDGIAGEPRRVKVRTRVRRRRSSAIPANAPQSDV